MVSASAVYNGRANLCASRTSVCPVWHSRCDFRLAVSASRPSRHACDHRLPDGQPAQRAEGVRARRARGGDHERSERARSSRQARAARRRGVCRRHCGVTATRPGRPIREAIASGKPFLGICLGLQLLFDVGYEDGTHEGLGVLAGEVRRFDVPPEYKVPHMGWNQVHLRRRPPHLRGRRGRGALLLRPLVLCGAERTKASLRGSRPIRTHSVRWRGATICLPRSFIPRRASAAGLQVLKNFAEL